MYVCMYVYIYTFCPVKCLFEKVDVGYIPVQQVPAAVSREADLKPIPGKLRVFKCTGCLTLL